MMSLATPLPSWPSPPPPLLPVTSVPVFLCWDDNFFELVAVWWATLFLSPVLGNLLASVLKLRGSDGREGGGPGWAWWCGLSGCFCSAAFFTSSLSLVISCSISCSRAEQHIVQASIVPLVSQTIYLHCKLSPQRQHMKKYIAPPRGYKWWRGHAPHRTYTAKFKNMELYITSSFHTVRTYPAYKMLARYSYTVLCCHIYLASAVHGV